MMKSFEWERKQKLERKMRDAIYTRKKSIKSTALKRIFTIDPKQAFLGNLLFQNRLQSDKLKIEEHPKTDKRILEKVIFLHSLTDRFAPIRSSMEKREARLANLISNVGNFPKKRPKSSQNTPSLLHISIDHPSSQGFAQNSELS